MLFIETPMFTKLILKWLPDDSYKQLQETLILRPNTGQIIQRSGGIRKMRWNLPGSGKSGGLRVIYYWDVGNDTIYMLLIYMKSKKEDLTAAQIKILRQLVKEWLK